MERHESERRLTPCAEFPNDNQDLHHGSVWAWVDLCDVPVCELPRTLSRSADRDEEPRDPGPLTDLAPLAPAPALQVVSLLTILEGLPRDAGPGRGEDVPSEPVAIANAVIDAAANSVAEPPLDAVPAERPQIVSLLTACEEAPAEASSLVASPSTRGDLDAEVCDDENEGEPIEIVDELSFVGEVNEGPADEASFDGPVHEGTSAEALAADPFTQLLSALAGVARALGAGDAAVASLDGLLGQSRFDGGGLDGRAAEALIAGDVIVRGGRGFARSPTFTAKVVAWQGILRGESEDFGLPDGGALEPLDEWAADLLARIVGPPARADGVRRDLRRRGVAAFGLVADAA